MKKVISITNLTKRFGTFTAVNGISFDVYKGEIFGFLGANGAGKTTAMRILCGLSSPSEGCGTVAGYDITKDGEKIKRSIGYMSQRFSLYDDLTVKENIMLFGSIYSVPRKELKQRASKTLTLLGMNEHKDSLVGSLPLGFKQKLAFITATIHKPEILFLDEPTGGVDPIARRQFWELIYEAADNGTTVLVTTHYMDEAEYCSRVSIMIDGRIAAMGSPKELKKEYGVTSTDELFTLLARGAKRT